MFHVICRSIIDGFLAIGHILNILFEGNLSVLGGIEQEEVTEKVLLHAVFVTHAALEADTEILEELLVLRAIFLLELFQLSLDALFQILADNLQLTVMLENLTGNIQGEIRRVNDALHKIKIIMNQLVALFHNHHTVAVKGDAFFIFTNQIHAVRLAGNKQHGLIGHLPFRIDASHGARILRGVIFLFVEADALLIRYLALTTLPDGNHAVDGLIFGDHLIIVFGGTVLILFAGFKAFLMGNIHFNGPANIVGIFFNQGFDLPDFEEGAVIFIFRVGFDVHNHIRAGRGTLRFRDSIAVCPFALPFCGGLFPILSGNHSHFIGNHKSRIEAYAKLADNGEVLLFCITELIFKCIRAAFRNDTEIILCLILRHTDSVIAYGNGTGFLIQHHINFKIISVQADFIVCQCLIAELVDCIGCIGNYFTKEYFLVGINGIDHEIKQAFAFRLKLFLCHGLKVQPPYEFAGLSGRKNMISRSFCRIGIL